MRFGNNSGKNREEFLLHFSLFEMHSGNSDWIWSALPVYVLHECDQSYSNAVRMRKERLDSSQNAVGVHFECRSIFFHFESTWKVFDSQKHSWLPQELAWIFGMHSERCWNLKKTIRSVRNILRISIPTAFLLIPTLVWRGYYQIWNN